MPVLTLENLSWRQADSIRPATVNDLNEVVVLLDHFADSAQLDYKNWTARDQQKAKQRIFDLIRNHYLIVADTGSKLVGMLGAQMEFDPWISHRRRLRELFWWMEPDFRKTRLSAKLFAQWQKDSDRYLTQGLVDQVSLSLQPGISQVDLSRKGWRCVEEHWIKG